MGKKMYYPTLEEVKKLKKQGNLVPVYREIKADLETPVSAYLKIARGNYSFLLESVEGGERLARYSFLGTEPSLILTTDQAVNPAHSTSPAGREVWRPAATGRKRVPEISNGAR